ncbi:cysteine--tRNA ligase [Zavarzinia sp. CC-PAN008]|uniref:cysteine--tRNA ligase n=1 Tax=Zavarzinia sp. CC-PAN008 TaxID=3243332 RepID=UPI003F742AB9
MSLVLYDSARRAKVPFEPLKPDAVGLYVCGPTVYDFAHIGNARPVIVFDILVRLLRRRYAHVTYVRNITDVDDKINAAAAQGGTSIAEVTARTTKAFHDDMAALGALPPDVEPRATEHIAHMIAMIQTLIGAGHAYVAEGHVLFEIATKPDYGHLSGRSLDEMIAGARVEVAPYKRAPGDFVLWKPSSPDIPGWDSPWGRGRPGWHIECSAMSLTHLGATFDIHGGGRDLIFPHHENECAQSECANGAPFARYWVHNGFLTVDGEKMSKSLGNFRTVRDVLASHAGEAIRLAMIATHYRQPLDWTDEGAVRAKGALDRWYRVLADNPADGDDLPAAVAAALDDDLNTPEAIAAMHQLASAGDAAGLRAAGRVLGLLEQAPEAWFRGETGDGPGAAEIERLIEARRDARKAKDFAGADRIRADLLAVGVILEDGPKGTTWRRA